MELVLALPILLMVMALMVNFGTVACWKVRGLTTARNALWSTRRPRSGATNPRPAYWPQSAQVGAGGAGNVAELDDPRVDLPVARGPLPGAEVNADLLDPTRGLRQATASMTRAHAMLSALGAFRVEAVALMLDDRWQFGQMGLSSSWQRRIPVIYQLQQAPDALSDAYVEAVKAIYYAPFRAALRPLDDDDEFIYYGRLFGWGGPPDFHPRLNSFCSLDRDLAGERVNELIDRIPSVAERMAREFIWLLYEPAIQAYEYLLAAEPPPSPAEQATMRADIDQLRRKIDQLNRFLRTLQN